MWFQLSLRTIFQLLSANIHVFLWSQWLMMDGEVTLHKIIALHFSVSNQWDALTVPPIHIFPPLGEYHARCCFNLFLENWCGIHSGYANLECKTAPIPFDLCVQWMSWMTRTLIMNAKWQSYIKGLILLIQWSHIWTLPLDVAKFSYWQLMGLTHTAILFRHRSQPCGTVAQKSISYGWVTSTRALMLADVAQSATNRTSTSIFQPNYQSCMICSDVLSGLLGCCGLFHCIINLCSLYGFMNL